MGQNRTIGQAQLGDLHPVLGQRAGLVGAEHGGRTQRLDRAGAAGQHPLARHPHCPHGHEHGQHHRELLGQHRHAQRDPGQRRFQPVTPQQAIKQRREQAGGSTQGGEPQHQPPGLLAQARCFGFERGECLADSADLARAAGGHDQAEPGPAHHQRSGIDEGQVIAAGAGHGGGLAGPARCLAHRHGFTREQRFIEMQPIVLRNPGIGGNPVSFAQHDEVTHHHLAPGNAQALAIADYQRARAGEVAQRLQRALGPAFLDHGDHDRERGKGHQHQRRA